MLIRHRATSLLLLAASACVNSPPPASIVTDEADQAVANTCDPRNYPCDPDDPFSNGICMIICEGRDGSGYGYCMPHTTVEDVWCAAHPGGFMSATRYCDIYGNPMWDTHCAPGWLP